MSSPRCYVILTTRCVKKRTIPHILASHSVFRLLVCPFWNPDCNLPEDRETLSQKYTTGLIVSKTLKIYSDILYIFIRKRMQKSIQTYIAHLSPKCYRESTSPKFCLHFRHQSPLTDSGFKMEELIGNLMFCRQQPWLSFILTQTIRTPHPQFLQEAIYVKIWPNFGLWCTPAPKWSNVPRI